MGTGPSALALSYSLPGMDVTGVSPSSNIQLGFNHKIVAENIVVLSAAEGVLSSTKSWNEAGTMITINPAMEALDLGDAITVVITGVTDIYGRILAPRTLNFSL
jgi:Bacterial Ig-like domain